MHYVVGGLLFGDEGKGHTVAKLTDVLGAKANIRFSGGCQAAHRVVRDGVSHVFAQFGSGSAVSSTVQTFITDKMAWNPLGLIREVEVHKINGLGDLLSRLFISPDCPTTTWYHRALNRAREIHREVTEGGRLSSVGLGVGDTFDDVRDHPELVLRASVAIEGDLWGLARALHRVELMGRLEAIRLAKNRAAGKLCPEAQGVYREALGPHYDSAHLCVEQLHALSPVLGPCIKRGFLDLLHRWLKSGPCIFEGSQGALLDMGIGTTPYITHSRTVVSEALPYLGGFEHTMLGVTRTYAHRHGKGPLPTENPALASTDLHNVFNEWQRGFRMGDLDLPLLRYSVKSVGCLDGIVVTHMDQIPESRHYCDRYDGMGNLTIRDLALCHNPVPRYETYDDVIELLTRELGLPVVAQSWSDKDKWTNIKV